LWAVCRWRCRIGIMHFRRLKQHLHICTHDEPPRHPCD